MLSSLPGAPRGAAAPLCWAVSLPSPARASSLRPRPLSATVPMPYHPAAQLSNDVRQVRCASWRVLGRSRLCTFSDRSFVLRTRPECPYAELGIDAICPLAERRPAKGIGSALKTGSFVVSRACLRTLRTASITLTLKKLRGGLDEALKQS